MPMPDWFDPSMLIGGQMPPQQPYLPPGLLQQMPPGMPPNLGMGPAGPGMAGPAPAPGGASLPPGIGMPGRQPLPAMPPGMPPMPMQNALQGLPGQLGQMPPNLMQLLRLRLGQQVPAGMY